MKEYKLEIILTPHSHDNQAKPIFGLFCSIVKTLGPTPVFVVGKRRR